ncbi:MAG: SAM-dependent chlorinase/fluorinase [Cyclobacteriaceae bacterium]|nr:SAM-dependent chlorinase/fluorinase [Cyclobacteriaceae bacterium]
MALITFMSDFGNTDHYTAAVKAKILTVNPGLQIIDISHNIEPYNLAHAAYVLGAVFRSFPPGTIHLVAVDSASEKKSRFIAIKLEGHFFIGADNGLFGLISDQEPSFIAEIKSAAEDLTSFPARELLAKNAALLASGSNLDDIGKFSKDYKKLIGRKNRATKSQISGHVIRVDNYGNLITNIDKTTFEILSKEKSYTLNFGREKLQSLHKNYNDVDAGDCFAFFNSNQLLEIGINKGNASELLGLVYDSPVSILFS